LTGLFRKTSPSPATCSIPPEQLILLHGLYRRKPCENLIQVEARFVGKAEIRASALKARRGLNPNEVRGKNAAIFAALQTFPLVVSAQTILCYVSSKDNEVDTERLITWLLEMDRSVLVPIALANRALEWSRLLSLEDLTRGRFDILEPRLDRRRIEVPPRDAVVIVPGVAFRPDGYRLGYGAGYFDRFLSNHRGPRIGLAFDVQVTESFQPDPHDVPVDYVVTESRVFQRRPPE